MYVIPKYNSLFFSFVQSLTYVFCKTKYPPNPAPKKMQPIIVTGYNKYSLQILDFILFASHLET